MPRMLRSLSLAVAAGPSRIARLGAWFDVRDATFLVGLGLLSVGAAMAYEPAGLMVPGVVLIWQAVGRRAS